MFGRSTSSSTSSSSASRPATGPTSSATDIEHPKGYGNIYTPHAGSMIIQVQRESGLQNRTFILGPRQVRFLRFLTSRTGKLIAAATLATILLLGIEAARVPFLSSRIASMQHTATRLDTLEHSLTELQKRYDQIQHMLGATPQTALTPAPPSFVRPAHSNARRASSAHDESGTAEPDAPAAEPASSDPGAPAGVPDTAAKSSLPTD